MISARRRILRMTVFEIGLFMLIIEIFIYVASFLALTLTVTSHFMRNKVSAEKQEVIAKNLPIMIVASCATTFLFIPNLSFIHGLLGTMLWFIAPAIIISSILAFRRIKKI